MSALPTDEVVATGPALLLRQLEDKDIACPAGRVVGDACVFCSIEEGPIDGRTQTMSVTGFCMSVEGHKTCPTWQAEKERIAANRTEKLTAAPDITKTPKALREQRLREAQERLVSNTKEGRKFRKRLGLREEL
jgi:hypothetical protein